MKNKNNGRIRVFLIAALVIVSGVSAFVAAKYIQRISKDSDYLELPQMEFADSTDVSYPVDMYVRATAVTYWEMLQNPGHEDGTEDDWQITAADPWGSASAVTYNDNDWYLNDDGYWYYRIMLPHDTKITAGLVEAVDPPEPEENCRAAYKVLYEFLEAGLTDTPGGRKDTADAAWGVIYTNNNLVIE